MEKVFLIVFGLFFCFMYFRELGLFGGNKKKPTYNDLVKRNKELRFLTKSQPDNAEWSEELKQVVLDLRDFDKLFPRHANNCLKENYVPEYNLEDADKEMKRILNARPDLSFLTQRSFVDYNEYCSFCQEAHAQNKFGFTKAAMIRNSECAIPVLISIAEMYHDTMIGTPQEKSIPFMIVDKCLKDIANGKQ